MERLDTGRIVVLDWDNPDVYADVRVKQYDNAEDILEVYLSRSGVDVDTSGMEFTIQATRTDGQAIYNVAPASANIVTVTLTEAMTSVPGTYYVDLIATKEDFRMSRRAFKLVVDKAAVQNITIVSSPEYLKLQDMIQTVSTMSDATAAAIQATTTANLAANNALASVAACEGALDGQNTMVDTTTAKAYKLGITGGVIYLEEVAVDATTSTQ